MADTDDTPMPFTIAEAVGANRVTVTLDDRDTPFGMPRKHEIFALGGENEAEIIRLNGRQQPIVHTKYTVWEPTIIKGHLRDTFSGDVGRGQRTVDKLQTILDNQRLCDLTWGPWTWRVFPKKFRLPVEGTGDFTYELKFEVLTRPGWKPPPPRDKQLEAFPYDQTADIRATLADLRATFLAQQILVSLYIAWTFAFDAIDDALDDTMSAAQSFENADAKAVAESKLLSSKAQATKDRCDDLYAMLSTADAPSSMTSTNEGDLITFSSAQLSVLSSLDECKKRMRTMQYTARQRVLAATKTYRVAAGDTLDSIATDQLGSSARALDIGLREQDLVVGRLIRLPA